MYQVYRTYDIPVEELLVPADPRLIDRGARIAATGCASCHSVDGELPLTGGFNLSDGAGLPLGDLYTPNITLAGRIATMTGGEIFRVLRTGVASDGRFTELKALYLYITSLSHTVLE